MDRRRIILDTDPGIDDALALLLAIASPEVTLEAITIVHGNCAVSQGVQNALRLLELAQATHIPVAAGADRPLIQPLLLAPETHGDSGMGYAELPATNLVPHPQHAVDLLIEHIMASPGEITVVAIGPLTNLALALRLEPRLANTIKEVFIMGGAIRHEGNTTPLAEFNIYCDPHAAKIVFQSGLPITLAPLDVTYQAILTPGDVNRLLRHPSPLSRFIADSTRYYMQFHDEYQSIQGCVINDPLALAILFRPDLVDTQALFVDVDISGGIAHGKTIADFYHMLKHPANMHVALGVRPREFLELFLTRMETLATQLSND